MPSRSQVTSLAGEPVAIVGAVQTLLIVAISFGWLKFVGLNSQNDVMTVVAVLSAAGAVYLAYKTSRTLLAPVMQLFSALAAVAAIYGFHLSTEQTGAIVAAITALLAIFHQSQVSPLAEGSFDLAA